MMTLPLTSVISEPGGMATEARGPAATTLPLRSTSTPSGMSAPAIVMSRAPLNACDRCCAEGAAAASNDSASASAARETDVMNGSSAPPISGCLRSEDW
jgi:hypothetical protein